MKEKTLILIRHAHRDKVALDNGLSDKGRNQADTLAAHFKKRLGGLDCALMSSPRRRCQETMEPIFKALIKADGAVQDEEVVVSELLCEGAGIRGRCEKFLHWFLQEGPDLLLACSHGDWIPEFFHMVFDHDIVLKKAGYVQINFIGSKPMLVNLVQRVD